MLDIAFIREFTEIVKAGAKKSTKVDVDRLLEVDRQRRALITDIERLRAKRNRHSKMVAGLLGTSARRWSPKRGRLQRN